MSGILYLSVTVITFIINLILTILIYSDELKNKYTRDEALTNVGLGIWVSIICAILWPFYVPAIIISLFLLFINHIITMLVKNYLAKKYD